MQLYFEVDMDSSFTSILYRIEWIFVQ